MAKNSSKKQDDFDGIDVSVEVGKFADGDTAIGLPVAFDRKKFKSKDAERFLCGARVNVQICKDANAVDDIPGQEPFSKYDDEDVLEAVCDFKSYRATRYGFAAKAVFSCDEVDKHKVLNFASTAGRLRMERIGDAPDGRTKAGKTTEADTSDDAQGQLGLDAE